MLPRQCKVVQPVVADAAPAHVGAGADEELEEVLDCIGGFADVVGLAAEGVVQVRSDRAPAGERGGGGEPGVGEVGRA